MKANFKENYKFLRSSKLRASLFRLNFEIVVSKTSAITL